MNEKIIIVTAYKGKLKEMFYRDEYKGISPIIEIINGAESYDSITIAENFDHKEEEQKHLFAKLQKVYNSWGKYGSYGDIIKLVRCYEWYRVKGNYLYEIMFMGNIAWHKPVLAADIVPIIHDKKGNSWLIGIIRKKDPGKGKPALIGGHLDVNGIHLETPAEALIHEAMDEAGINIIIGKADHDNLINKPNHLRFVCDVKIGQIAVRAAYQYIGTFPTSDSEVEKTTGLKRVYLTTAYALRIDLYTDLTKEQILQQFTAGDDASEVFIYKIDTNQPFDENQIPDFAFAHHKEIYRQTIKLFRACCWIAFPGDAPTNLMT